MLRRPSPSTDWIPPAVIATSTNFKYDRLLEFLIQLDNKFSADWIAQYTPTDRIDNMNQVIKVVESKTDSKDVLADPCFKIDADAFQSCGRSVRLRA